MKQLRTRRLCRSTALPLLMLAAGCGAEHAPQCFQRISVDACDDTERNVNCLLYFGDVALGSQSQRSVKVANPAVQGELSVSRIEITDDQHDSYAVDGSTGGFSVPGGGESAVVVSFSPPQSGQFLAKLLIYSDACDLPEGVPTEVVLQGNGT